MKAEHLMIGNYVKPTGIDFGDRHREINQIHLLNNQYIVYFKSYPVGCYLDKLEPIPLDEEWFLRFGFAYKKPYAGGQDEWAGYGFWSFNELHLIGNKQGVDVYMDRNTNWKIKYVHQLQNLYLALTGTPLTIKTESK